MLPILASALQLRWYCIWNGEDLPKKKYCLYQSKLFVTPQAFCFKCKLYKKATAPVYSLNAGTEIQCHG